MTSSAKFPLGSLVATRHALDTLPADEILKALCRHISGDWGDLDADDWQANEQALAFNERIFSVYHSEEGVKFYVITEWDRSATTVLLPEDY